MANFEMKIPHQLGAEEVTSRVKNLMNNLRSEHSDKVKDLTENWNGNSVHISGTAMNFSLEVNVKINDSEVELSTELPFAVSLFKGKIKEMIEEQMKKALAK